ncbi:hypothetical protein C8T65DRAFT_708596 [Cerioporus squamosus]|nr:hypothetical protein C8T65DRAFT_708596 [Cerioporus squamosus]
MDLRGMEAVQEGTRQDISKLQDRNSTLETRNEALLKCVKRAPAQAARAVDKAVNSAVKQITSFKLKEKGIISDRSRDLVRSLTYAGVPRDNIPAAVSSVAEAAGFTVEGAISSRSVGRINLEGGILSDLQTIEDMMDADGITVSSDGTTIKHVPHEARHAYINKGTTHTRHFLGVTTAPNHTSEEQLRGWLEALESLCTTWNMSPRGQHDPMHVADILRKVTGMNTDHAEDQKKLVRLFMELKETDKVIKKAGGSARWEQLPEAERAKRVHEATRRATIRFGEARFAALPDEDKRAADLFVWAGCCMHKELNSVKGGAAALAAFWKDNGLPAPLLLMNRDNAAAAALGPSAAKDRATEVSQGGAVKLTSLAGALFRHKDDKKGQQDTLRIFFEAAEAVGFSIKFPDTSNTRYQSHCEAAAELLVYLPLYREFLEVIRDKKGDRSWTNIEQNVYDGLHDTSTLTELCVLALYSQAVSHPYMRAVRGPDQLSANILNLGPLHERVKAHCRAIIENPDILLGPSMSHTTGALDVLRMAPDLPHLRGALVAFFTGALMTWERFTAEFAGDSVIATLSSTERETAWMRATNDDNEGALGHVRHQYNARQKGKVNDVAEYSKRKADKETHAFVRKRARILDSSGLEKQQKAVIAAADKAVVQGKRDKDQEREEKAKEKTRVLDGLVLLLDVADITLRAKEITNAELDQQLDWHRRKEGKSTQIPAKSRIAKKAEKIEALCAAVQRYNDLHGTPGGSGEGSEEAMEVVVGGENIDHGK